VRLSATRFTGTPSGAAPEKQAAVSGWDLASIRLRDAIAARTPRRTMCGGSQREDAFAPFDRLDVVADSSQRIVRMFILTSKGSGLLVNH